MGVLGDGAPGLSGDQEPGLPWEGQGCRGTEA